MLKDITKMFVKSAMQKAIEQENKTVAQNYAPMPVMLIKGEGLYLWDMDGKGYIDMMGAYSAVSLGHSHPRIVAKLAEQAKTLAMTSRAFHNNLLGPLSAKLCEITGLDSVLPMNTGAEAVETAVKAARRWGYRVKKIPEDAAEIIVAEDNFHGRTTTIVSFSTEYDYREGFGPFTPGFVSAPYDEIEAYEEAMTKNTCAVLIEPIQGEAGVRLPRPGFMKKLRQLCTERNVLLIVDEVQSGLGRTGAMFCYQHDNIQPDGVIVGKALGGGLLPISAFIAKKEVMDVFNPGSHGSTFGGNPLACAVALETLAVLEEEHLLMNSEIIGDYFLTKLKTVRSPLVKDVRGRGLWVAMEVDTEKVSARQVCDKLMELGILTKDTHGSVVRFSPPLTIKREMIDTCLQLIKEALSQLEKKVMSAKSKE